WHHERRSPQAPDGARGTPRAERCAPAAHRKSRLDLDWRGGAGMTSAPYAIHQNASVLRRSFECQPRLTRIGKTFKRSQAGPTRGSMLRCLSIPRPLEKKLLGRFSCRTDHMDAAWSKMNRDRSVKALVGITQHNAGTRTRNASQRGSGREVA